MDSSSCGTRCCAQNAEGSLLATGDLRGEVKVWTVSAEKGGHVDGPVLLPACSPSPVRCLAFGLVAASRTEWSSATAAKNKEDQGEAEENAEAAGGVQEEGSDSAETRRVEGRQCLLGGFDDGHIGVWVAVTEGSWRLVHEVRQAHAATVRSILLLEDDLGTPAAARRFVTAADDSTMKFWTFQVDVGDAAEEVFSCALNQTQRLYQESDETAAAGGAGVIGLHLWKDREGAAARGRSKNGVGSACKRAPVFCASGGDARVTAWRSSEQDGSSWKAAEDFRLGLASNAKGFMQVVVGGGETVGVVHGSCVSLWSRKAASDAPQSEAQDAIPSAYERMGRDTGRLERAQLTELGWTLDALADPSLERVRAATFSEDGELLAVVDWAGHVVAWLRGPARRETRAKLSAEGQSRWVRVFESDTGEDCWAMTFGRGEAASLLFVCNDKGDVKPIDATGWRPKVQPPGAADGALDSPRTQAAMDGREAAHTTASAAQAQAPEQTDGAGTSGAGTAAEDGGKKASTDAMDAQPKSGEATEEKSADAAAPDAAAEESPRGEQADSDAEAKPNGFSGVRPFQRRFQRGQVVMRGALGRRLLDRVGQKESEPDLPQIPVLPMKRGPGRPPKYGTARWKERYLAARGGIMAPMPGRPPAQPKPAPAVVASPRLAATSSESKESRAAAAAAAAAEEEERAGAAGSHGTLSFSTVQELPKLEALASDGAWYDVSLLEQRADGMIRAKMVNCNQRGFEWLEARHIRRRSDVFAPGQVPQVGDHVLAYQQRPQHDLYYDAEVIAVREKQSLAEKNVVVVYLHGPEQGCTESLALSSLLKVHTEPIPLYTLRKSIMAKSGGLMPRHSTRLGEQTRVGGKSGRALRDRTTSGASDAADADGHGPMETPRSESDSVAARSRRSVSVERESRRATAAAGSAAEGAEDSAAPSRSQSPPGTDRRGGNSHGGDEAGPGTNGAGAPFGGYESKAALRNAMRTILLSWKSALDSQVRHFKELLHTAHPELAPTARIVSETNLIIDGTGDILHKVVVDKDGMPGIRDCTLPERTATLKLIGGSSLAASAQPELRKGSTQYSRWHLPVNLEDVQRTPSFLRSHGDGKRAVRASEPAEDKSEDEGEPEGKISSAYGLWLQSVRESPLWTEKLELMSIPERARALGKRWAALSKDELQRWEKMAAEERKAMQRSTAPTWRSTVDDVGSASRDQWLRLRAMGIGRKKAELEFTFVPSNASSTSTSHAWWPPTLDPLLNHASLPSPTPPMHSMPRRQEVEGGWARKVEGEGEGPSRALPHNRMGIVCAYHPEIDGLQVYVHPTGVGDYRKFKGKLVQDASTGKIAVVTKEWGTHSLTTWLEKAGNHSRRAFANVFLSGSEPPLNLKSYLARFTEDSQPAEARADGPSRRKGDAKGDSQGDLGLWRFTGSSFLGVEIKRTVVEESSDSDDGSDNDDKVITAKIIAWITADESDFTSDATGKPAALWKCIHTDGDFEDLEESEVLEGLEAAGKAVEPHRPTSEVLLETVAVGTDPIIAILHQAVQYLGGFEEVSLKRKWKKLARGLDVKNSSHLKQKYYDWFIMQPHPSAVSWATHDEDRPRGLEALRQLVAKRSQDKDNNAVYIQDRKREGKPRTLAHVAEAAVRLVDSLRSNAYIFKGALSSKLLRSRFKQRLRGAELSGIGRLLEKLESNLNWGAMTLDFDGIRDDLLASFEALESVQDAFLAVEAINFCVKEKFRRRTAAKAAEENGSGSDTGDGEAESGAGSDGVAAGASSGRVTRRTESADTPSPAPVTPRGRRKRRRGGDGMSLPDKPKPKRASNGRFARGPDGRFSKTPKLEARAEGNAVNASADAAECGDQAMEDADRPEEAGKATTANGATEADSAHKGGVDAESVRRRGVLEDGGRGTGDSEEEDQLEEARGRSVASTRLNGAHVVAQEHALDDASSRRPFQTRPESGPLKRKAVDDSGAKEAEPPSKRTREEGAGAGAGGSRRARDVSEVAETEKKRKERMVAAAVSTHRKREAQSKSSISQVEIRKLLDGLSFERDQRHEKKKRSHKKQWKPAELVGRDIKIWSFLRDQRGGGRFAWRMATVKKLRNETRRVLHEVEWHDNKKQEWRNLEREKYAVPYVKLAKVAPVHGVPPLETRRMKKRPRVVDKPAATAAPQRSRPTMDATERYLARARNCAFLAAARPDGGAASSSARASSPNRSKVGERRASTGSNVKASSGSTAKSEKDDADLEAVSCQRCGSRKREASMLLCDGCDEGWHMECLDRPLKTLPQGSWFCSKCVASGNDLETAPRGSKSRKLPPPIQDPDANSKASSRRQSPSATSSPRVAAAGASSPHSRRPLPGLSLAGAAGAPPPLSQPGRPCHLSLKPPTPAGPGRRSQEPSPSSTKSSPMASSSVRRMSASSGR